MVFHTTHWLLEKSHQVVRDSLIERQHTLNDLEKAPDVAYQDVLCEFDFVWCVKGLITTHSNLMVAWKVQAQMDIISWFALFLPRWLYPPP